MSQKANSYQLKIRWIILYTFLILIIFLSTAFPIDKDKTSLVNNKISETEKKEISDLFKLLLTPFASLENLYIDSSKVSPDKLLYATIQGMVEAAKEKGVTLTGKPPGITICKGDKELKVSILPYSVPFRKKSSPGEMSRYDKLVTFYFYEIIKFFKVNCPDISLKEIIYSGIEQMTKSVDDKDCKIIPSSVYQEMKKEISQYDPFVGKLIPASGLILPPGNSKIKTVEYKMLKEEIGYIHISDFNCYTCDDVMYEALEDLKKKDMKKLILDLRNNCGRGFEVISIAIAVFFLPSSNITTYLTTRGGGAEFRFKTENEYWVSYPLVILINENTEGGAELIAGAIQDNKRGIIIGTKSRGRNSFQAIVSLPDGAGLSFTYMKWFTPKRKSIEGKGITPDIIVEDGEGDPQLQSAIEYLKKEKTQ